MHFLYIILPTLNLSSLCSCTKNRPKYLQIVAGQILSSKKSFRSRKSYQKLTQFSVKFFVLLFMAL